MKRTLLLALILCFAPVATVPLVTSCATSQTAYKTLAILATSVDTGMKAFAGAVSQNKVSVATQDKVRDAHGRYQKALQAAIAAARFDTSVAAPANVQNLANEVLNLVLEATKL